jgi:hypothetical protein
MNTPADPSRAIARMLGNLDDEDTATFNWLLATAREVAGPVQVRGRAKSTGGKRMSIEADTICGFCGLPGADKVPHPIRWPGEESAGTKYVHADCEDAECRRAHNLLSDKQRESFLRTI